MKDNPTRTDSRLATLGSVLANWRDWNLPVKLAAVTLVPVIFAIVLGAMQIADQVDRASSYRQVDRLVLANEELRALVTALQRERTASAMLLAERFSEMATELRDERAAVDDALAGFTRAADRVRFGEDVTAARYRDVSAWLGELRGLREQVGGSLIDASTVLSRYTSVVEALLRFDRALSSEMIDPHLVSTSGAQHELESIAEQVQFQHALIGVGIVRGGLVGPDLESLRASLASFEDSVASFRAVADAQYTQNFDRAITEPVSAGRTNLAGAVAASQPGARIPTTVVDWYASSDAAQRGIAEVADQLGGQVRERSTALQDEASDGAGIASVILLVALVFAIAVMIIVGRHLVSSLGVLRRSALEVAEQRLPEAVARIRDHGGDGAAIELEPVPVTTMDEVGQVARAFDAVQAQALRLATEQAGLRARYSSVFVNLSRRSQGLVQRQLHLLERLERDEEDADQLATLFQLDHLATRMRRNNENLMVLSGSDVSRRNQRPATLADLLRAAVSEIEQYQRVVMLPPPDVLVVGYAVGDLVRLTAELLDNATSFSAPDTNVTMASHSFDDGSVCVAVHDEGIGMNQEELDEANAKLADTTSIDVSTSRRMGLFVIGRLAGRHGIEVRLNSASDSSGVRATMTVPAELIAERTETPRSAPATTTALPSGGLVPFTPAVNGHGGAVNGSHGGSHGGAHSAANGGLRGGTANGGPRGANGGGPGSTNNGGPGSTNGGGPGSANGEARGSVNGGAPGSANGGKLPRRRARPVNGSSNAPGNHASGNGSGGASGDPASGNGTGSGSGGYTAGGHASGNGAGNGSGGYASGNHVSGSGAGNGSGGYTAGGHASGNGAGNGSGGYGPGGHASGSGTGNGSGGYSSGNHASGNGSGGASGDPASAGGAGNGSGSHTSGNGAGNGSGGYTSGNHASGNGSDGYALGGHASGNGSDGYASGNHASGNGSDGYASGGHASGNGSDGYGSGGHASGNGVGNGSGGYALGGHASGNRASGSGAGGYGSGNHSSGSHASGNGSRNGSGDQGSGNHDADQSPTIDMPALSGRRESGPGKPATGTAATGHANTAGGNTLGDNGTRAVNGRAVGDTRRRRAARRPVGDGPDPMPDPAGGHSDGRTGPAAGRAKIARTTSHRTDEGLANGGPSTADGPAVTDDWPGDDHESTSGWAADGQDAANTTETRPDAEAGATTAMIDDGREPGGTDDGPANGGRPGRAGAPRTGGHRPGVNNGNVANRNAPIRNTANRNATADRPGTNSGSARRTPPGGDTTRPDGERTPLPRRSPGRGGRNRPDGSRPHTPFSPAGELVSPADGLFFSPGGRGAGEPPPPAGAPRAPRPHPRRSSAGGSPPPRNSSLFTPWWPAGPPAAPRPLDETTPIFDEMVSAWFLADPPAREPAPPTAEPARPPGHPGQPWRFDADAGFDAARAASQVAPAEYTENGLPRRSPRQNLVPGSVTAQKGTSPPARAGKAAEELRERLSNYHHGVRRARDGGGPVEWHFAADGGWRAANAISSAKPVEFTPGGLPRRTPRDHLLPGSVPPASQDGQPRAERAEELRGRLGSFQQGLSRGRRSVADRPGANGIRDNEQQERE